MTAIELKKLKQMYTKKQLYALYWSQCLDDICLLLEIKLFPKQSEVLHGKQSITVMRSARRTAKSFSAAIRCYALLYFGRLFDYPMRMTLGSPRTKDTRHIWSYLNYFWEKAPLSALFDNCQIEYNNWKSHSNASKTWEFVDGTKITTASCDDPEMNDIRGDANDFIFIDEFGQVRYKEALLAAMMYSLKDDIPLNTGWIVGTPDVVGTGAEFNHLMKLGEDGRKDIVSIHLKGTDNPYSDKGSSETAKDIVDENTFLREQEGEAVPFGGRLFTEFQSKKAVQKVIYDPSLFYIRGLDFGMRKPYWCDFQYINDIVYVFHEYSGKDIRIASLVGEMKTREFAYMNDAPPGVLGCDPAGNKVNDVININAYEILKQSYPMADYTHNNRLVSKSNQVMLLKALMIKGRLIIDESCERLINAIRSATPDANRLGAINSPGWKKEKGIDDPLDGLCYGLINFGPTSELIIPKQEKETLTVDTAAQIAQLMAG